MSPMKKFHLFQFGTYHPSGGMGDYDGSYDTVEEAKAAVGKTSENCQIAEAAEDGSLSIVLWGSYGKWE